jgi:hypothetical protein
VCSMSINVQLAHFRSFPFTPAISDDGEMGVATRSQERPKSVVDQLSPQAKRGRYCRSDDPDIPILKQAKGEYAKLQ